MLAALRPAAKTADCGLQTAETEIRSPQSAVREPFYALTASVSFEASEITFCAR